MSSWVNGESVDLVACTVAHIGLVGRFKPCEIELLLNQPYCVTLHGPLLLPTTALEAPVRKASSLHLKARYLQNDRWLSLYESAKLALALLRQAGINKHTAIRTHPSIAKEREAYHQRGCQNSTRDSTAPAPRRHDAAALARRMLTPKAAHPLPLQQCQFKAAVGQN